MLDRTIPFYNTILKCNNYTPSKIVLPHGFYFRNYQTGNEKAWAKLEYKIGDFQTLAMAENYFLSEYCQNIHALKERCVFILNQEDEVVGSCIAWKDNKGKQTVAS